MQCLTSITQEPRTVWLLLKNGARVFQRNFLGLSPIHIAAGNGNHKALKSLLLYAQDCVDIPSNTKEAPLFLAVKNGSLSCVQLLLRSGANPKAQNLCKQMPLHVATSLDMRFVLKSANVTRVKQGSLEKKQTMVKRKRKEHPPGDDEFCELQLDNSDYCIISSSCEATMEPVPCLQKICVANMKRCNEKDHDTLFIDSPAGRLSLQIDMDELCVELRKRIEEKVGHPIETFTLRVGHLVLDNDRSLRSYGLSRYSVIDMYPGLLGGDDRERPAKRRRWAEPAAALPVQPAALPVQPAALPVQLAARAAAELLVQQPTLLVQQPGHNLLAYIGLEGTPAELYTVTTIPSLLTNDPNDTVDVNEMTPGGRRLGKSLVKNFVAVSQRRRTWNGEIALSDFVMCNGRAVCTKEATASRTNGSWVKDCKALGGFLTTIYPSEMNFPYLSDLTASLVEPAGGLAFEDWFRDYQRTHLSFKSSIRRGTVSYDIFRMFLLASPEDKAKIKGIMQKVKCKPWTQCRNFPVGHIFEPTVSWYLNKYKTDIPNDGFGCFIGERNYGAHGKRLPCHKTELVVPVILGNFVCEVIKELLRAKINIQPCLEDDD